MTHVIRPALEKGMIVLCDRFFDSTLAYQGSARGLDPTFLIDAQQFVANGLQPHLTFFLDLPIQDGLARRQQTKKHDRLDQESLSFHQRVRRGFLALAKQHPQRIHKVDAAQAPQALTSHIAAIVEKMITKTTSRRVIHSARKR
jgi:dTMP kinase